MKTEVFKRLLIEELYLKKWIRNGSWTWNEDETIDVKGSVQVMMYKGSKLPVKFNYVSDYFSCSFNTLTSLEGCPSFVGRYFNCQNNLLSSIEFAPKSVATNFYCQMNLVKFSKDEITKICHVGGSINP